MNSGDWSGLRARACRSYLERQFSFVSHSLAQKRVLAAGLSGQCRINHMEPTATEDATKGQDLMSSAENTKLREHWSTARPIQCKYFFSFPQNKPFPARIRWAGQGIVCSPNNTLQYNPLAFMMRGKQKPKVSFSLDLGQFFKC